MLQRYYALLASANLAAQGGVSGEALAGGPGVVPPGAADREQLRPMLERARASNTDLIRKSFIDANVALRNKKWKHAAQFFANTMMMLQMPHDVQDEEVLEAKLGLVEARLGEKNYELALSIAEECTQDAKGGSNPKVPILSFITFSLL